MSWVTPIVAVTFSVLHLLSSSLMRRRWQNKDLADDARAHLRDSLSRFHHSMVPAATALLMFIFTGLSAARGALAWWLLLAAAIVLSISAVRIARLRGQATGLGPFQLSPDAGPRRVWATWLWTVALISAVGMQLSVWLAPSPAGWTSIVLWSLWGLVVFAFPIGGILGLIANTDDAEAAWRRERAGR